MRGLTQHQLFTPDSAHAPARLGAAMGALARRLKHFKSSANPKKELRLLVVEEPARSPVNVLFEGALNLRRQLRGSPSDLYIEEEHAGAHQSARRSQAHMQEIELMHLVWKPAGIEPLRNFVRAYREHPAGIDHKLVVLYNGFRGDDLDDHRELLTDTPHRELRLPARVLDINAYVWGAQRAESRYVCFVNSYSTPLASGWLRALHEHVAQPGVGAVGATGSWESFYTDYRRSRAGLAPLSSLTQRAKTLLRRLSLRRHHAQFHPAPNPHLRTNGFMIERSRWLSLQIPPLRSKWDAWRFESGKEGMTRQLKSAGLEVLVVGRNGVAYQNEKWRESDTFRNGNQENLLVADNRTREYDEAGAEARRCLRLLAWGDG